jgi:SAM-dependent methyltransferase
MSNSHDLKTYRRRLQNPTRAEKYATRFERGSRQRIDRREQRAVRKIFGGLIDCGSVLDIPSGAGRFLPTLALEGRRIVEIDVAFEILVFARKRALNYGALVNAIQGDASRLPLMNGAVDCVFSNRLLHHILPSAERLVLLREFHRVCRRWTVVSFFNYKGMAKVREILKRLKGRQPAYQNQPTIEEFGAEVVQSGFRVQSIVATGLPWVSQRYFVLEKKTPEESFSSVR